MSTPTPHISANSGDFAKTVLMPGDPLRAKFIADTFLEQARLVNNVRGVQGYTGTFCGLPVSVMASGMGIPSIGIYSYELFSFYGVEHIIRVGSAGALSDTLHLRDIVFGMGASTNSNFSHQFQLPGTFAPIASYSLLQTAIGVAKEMHIQPTVGNLLSADNFYDDSPDALSRWKQMGILAVEMESAGLYMTAARLQKQALAICTISDHIFTGESLDAQARQSTFIQMMELALNTAVALA